MIMDKPQTTMKNQLVHVVFASLEEKHNYVVKMLDRIGREVDEAETEASSGEHEEQNLN